MKLKPKSASRRRCKPFLILPAIPSPDQPRYSKMVKNPGLKLFTKTWPAKRETKSGKEDPTRPLTATLEKPSILDIKFVGKVDMSVVRKEFLNITNLCRAPLVGRRKGQPKAKPCRPLSLPAKTDGKKRVKKRADTSGEDSWEDEESTRYSGRRSVSKQPKPSAAVLGTGRPRAKVAAVAVAVASDANNNTRPAPRRPPAVAAPPSTKLPEPCTTCGRPDLPERFHSHPSTIPARKKDKEKEVVPAKVPLVKSTVQKPVAIKYKSKQTIVEDNKKPPQTRKPSLPSQVLVHTPPAPAPAPATNADMGRVRSAKRTLTCYICSREFGTASLPLHEPKCLEKFHRENNSLPLHLRRKLPPKPDENVSQEEWNKLAWEASQSSLTPCANCGRTFYPDRLVVHQRSCKTTTNNQRRPGSLAALPPAMAQRPSQSASPQEGPAKSPGAAHQPPTLICYICGRPFGTHSIAIHERQCLRKWHQENDALPLDMQSRPPVRPTNDNKTSGPEIPAVQERPEAGASEDNRKTSSSGGSGRRPPLFPCYLCGKLFSVHSIYVHEPQCLKKWQIENDKLPPNKRRPVPLKPDIKFTQEGVIDFEATNEANWRSHLSQLVPCRLCNRKFNPDRVDVHEKSCKGT